MHSGFINGKCPGSHTSAGSLSFKKLLIGGYEWVRIQHRLCVLREVRIGMGCIKVVIVIAWYTWVPVKYAVGVLPYNW